MTRVNRTQYINLHKHTINLKSTWLSIHNRETKLNLKVEDKNNFISLSHKIVQYIS